MDSQPKGYYLENQYTIGVLALQGSVFIYNEARLIPNSDFTSGLSNQGRHITTDVDCEPSTWCAPPNPGFALSKLKLLIVRHLGLQLVTRRALASARHLPLSCPGHSRARLPWKRVRGQRRYDFGAEKRRRGWVNRQIARHCQHMPAQAFPTAVPC